MDDERVDRPRRVLADVGAEGPEHLPRTLPRPFSMRDMMAGLGLPRPTSVVDFEPPELTPIGKPLAECTIGVFVSAGVQHPSQEPLGTGNDLSYRLLDTAWPLEELVLAHRAAIRHFAAQDLSVAYPRDSLLQLEAQGVFGRLAPEVVSMVGAVTAYTDLMQQTVPAVHAELVRQGVDLVLLLPFCPACHTAVPLIARGLEKRGLPTIMTSCLWEAARAVKAPRTAFLDFPMGCPAGRPHRPEQQREILRRTLESAHGFSAPWEILELDFQWAADGNRDWFEEVRRLYVEDADGFAQRVATIGSGRELLAGQEKAFTVRCTC